MQRLALDVQRLQRQKKAEDQEVQKPKELLQKADRFLCGTALLESVPMNSGGGGLSAIGGLEGPEIPLLANTISQSIEGRRRT